MKKPISPLPPSPLPVSEKAPTGACDTHVHILGSPQEFALFEGRTEDPAQSYAAYLSDYKAHLENLGITRGVVVVDWNLAGVRLNYVHGGVLTWDGAKAMAPRLAERGLHIQMLMHADKHMEDLAADVKACPVPVVFDHIGWPKDIQTPDNAGFQALCRALAEGAAYVKLSGLYRLSNAPYDVLDAHIAALVAANPERCLWGSDWPHIMLNGAQMPQGADLWHAFLRAVPDPATRHHILVENPARLYRFDT